MRTLVISSLFILGSLGAIAQDGSKGTGPRFNVTERWMNKISIQKAKEVKVLTDIFPDYSSHWVSEYSGVKVSATCNGKTISSQTEGGNLSDQQLAILHSADNSTSIDLVVNYKYKNAVTDKMENGKINYRLMVVPEKEAGFPGGNVELTSYLKERIYKQVKDMGKDDSYFSAVTVSFKVNEDGTVSDAEVLNFDISKEIKSIILKTVNNMPKWTPAENGGMKVYQVKTLNFGGVGLSGGGC